MRVSDHGEDGILQIRLDDMADEEGVAELEPDRRGRCRPAP